MAPSSPTLLNVLYSGRVYDSVKWFFCHWVDCAVFVPYSVDLAYYIIDFWILNQLRILGINVTWSWYLIFFVCCQSQSPRFFFFFWRGGGYLYLYSQEILTCTFPFLVISLVGVLLSQPKLKIQNEFRGSFSRQREKYKIIGCHDENSKGRTWYL